MNNILHKGVKITLDKPRILAYPMSAMSYLAEVYGSVPEAFETFQSTMPKAAQEGQPATTIKMDKRTIDILVHFVTAGFQADDPEITFQDVNALVDFINFGEVMGAVTKALMAYMPQGVATPTPTRRPKSKK